MKTFKVTIVSKGESYTFEDIWKIIRTGSGYRLIGESECQSFGIYYHEDDVDFIKIENLEGNND